MPVRKRSKPITNGKNNKQEFRAFDELHGGLGQIWLLIQNSVSNIGALVITIICVPE